ncbi:hypothetical protein BDV95DRAFT_587907 [Massariosphaeria phaeospora]|uniref:F-box domain-containing protein n=1 Tax=Massariosphaeria phaeospora TaxID=100035 RepID=A0A7C8M0E4_9PLEO|nr:hypothetical protein BDV95DRAFT_587907 [Massariosphaeria phaeospora]
MAPITHLPNELLNAIFADLEPRSLLALALTCKRLHEPARAQFLENVVLSWKMNTNAVLARFVRHNAGNGLVKSIRLQPQVGLLQGFMIGMQHASHHIDVLCSCLGSLPQLATFSINIDGHADRRCILPAFAISRIINALPPSVINLELDTEGLDGIWEDRPTRTSTPHLCHDISKLLLQLHTLRLRISCMCTDIFRALQAQGTHQPTSTLRLASIKLEHDPENRMGHPGCVCDCQMQKTLMSQGYLVPNKLFRHALPLRSAGAFPHLSRFIILSQALGQDFIRVRDVATHTMTEYPVKRRNRGWGGEYVVRGHDNEEYFGSARDIETAIMHEVHWSEASNGSRLPPSRPIKNVEPRLLTSLLKSTAEFRKAQDENCPGARLRTEFGIDVIRAAPHEHFTNKQKVIVNRET